MKKTKKGFSLAELLIAMGIVSVVATLGFSVAKRGIEDAYNIYIYTGYKGVMDAIGHATGRNINIYNGQNAFVADLGKTLNGTVSGSTLTAPNGIIYKFDTLAPKDGKRYYLITMQVPSVKKNGSSRRTLCLGYSPDDDWSILLPLDKYTSAEASCTSSIPTPYTRRDLLAFYVDDGYVGRRLPPDYTYKPRKFVSAQQAICEVHGTVSFGGLNPISCTGISQGTANARIKAIHPKKAN